MDMEEEWTYGRKCGGGGGVRCKEELGEENINMIMGTRGRRSVCIPVRRAWEEIDKK